MSSRFLVGPLAAGRHLAALILAAACVAMSPVQAQAQAQTVTPDDAPPARKALRVCQDPNNMPFSNLKGEGIENKLAELFGTAMGLPVTYFSFPQRLAFVRNTLRYKLPGEDFPCDIIMSMPVGGGGGAQVTKPLYRSTYALVFAKGKGMDQVSSSADFLALDRAFLSRLRIGIYDKSPASDWLFRHQLTDQGVPYPIRNANPDQYPGEIIEKDLTAGKIDVAIVWGPIAGYFAQRIQSPQLVVIPLKSEPGVRMSFEMGIGLRFGEREWKQQIEGLIDSQRAGIDAILKEFGVPVVDDSYDLRRN
jgi:quinoprotein dehydrogenase-associated probable ABC transporter substrate-binding protein